VHEEGDVRHRAAWREWLAQQQNIDEVAVLCATERSLKALWGALDAVYPEGCAPKKQPTKKPSGDASGHNTPSHYPGF